MRFHAQARDFFWTHPEWWTLALAAVAWGMILSYAIAHQGHAQATISFLPEFSNWGLMVMAMMVPLVLAPLRWVAFRSFRYRRHQAILWFLIGFFVPWLLIGLGVAWLQTLQVSHNLFLAPALFALSALWVLAPLRKRAFVYCHSTVPLAPSGWHADRDCLKFGALIGSSCLATCGLLMVACALTAHNPIALLGGTVLGVMEYRAYRPSHGSLFVGTLLLAFWFLMPFNYAALP